VRDGTWNVVLLRPVELTLKAVRPQTDPLPSTQMIETIHLVGVVLFGG